MRRKGREFGKSFAELSWLLQLVRNLPGRKRERRERVFQEKLKSVQKEKKRVLLKCWGDDSSDRGSRA